MIDSESVCPRGFGISHLACREMRRVSAIRRTLPLLRLPLRVARFFFRARRLAARTGDDWSLASATHPEPLAVLLRLARGRRRVVGVGAGTAGATASFGL